MRSAILAVFLLTLVPILAAADRVEPVQAELPPGSIGGAAVWAEGAMYVFGGYDWSAQGPARAVDRIVRYDPATGAVETMDARLPSGRWYTPAVWTGEKVYLFGGNQYANLGRDVVEYDPASDTIRVLDAQLPSPMQGAAAVWTGSVVYVLGGDASWDDGLVLRFDPSTGTLATLPHRIPDGFGRFASAAWAEGAAWLVGNTAGENPGGRILRVEPESGAFSFVPHELPRAAWAPPLVADGPKIYVWGVAQRSDEILRFDAATGHLAIMPGRAPGYGGAIAAWDGARAHVFRGAGCVPAELCTAAHAYTPQPEVPPPTIEITRAEFSIFQGSDGEFARAVDLDVRVSGAPAYDPQVLLSPAPVAGTALGLEEPMRDVFRIDRYEARTYHRLLFVSDAAALSPTACVRIVAQSGSTEFGAVASNTVCDVQASVTRLVE